MKYALNHPHSHHRTLTLAILALGVLFLSYYFGSWYGHLLAQGYICHSSHVVGLLK